MTPITPHPFATWVQMQVSPQRHAARRRRRRKAARILAAQEQAARPTAPPTPAVTPVLPRQRKGEDTPAPVRRPSQVRA